MPGARQGKGKGTRVERELLTIPSGPKSTLGDIGEFEFIRNYILPRFNGGDAGTRIGDDCAFVVIPQASEILVITSDVGPKPLVWHLGCESYKTWGWYCVAINASDLAAAGARPLAFVNSVEAPREMLVSDFAAVFDGIQEACRAHNLSPAGGNIREAPRFECHGTAIGVIGSGQMRIGRAGCTANDRLYVVGPLGEFMASYLKAALRGMDSLVQIERERLLRPRARTVEMQLLNEHGLVKAASDNSDGLLGAIWNIAEASSCEVEVFLDEGLISHAVCESAKANALDPWNLVFAWGDWQVVIAVDPGNADRLERLAAANNIPLSLLGRVTSDVGLWGLEDGHRIELKLVRNENFSASSYNSGIQAQLDFLLRTGLRR